MTNPTDSQGLEGNPTKAEEMRERIVAILLDRTTRYQKGEPQPKGAVEGSADYEADELLKLFTSALEAQDVEKVDRFEVIDETGRAYVKGSIYGTPVKIELSYQDDGRTLKVFVDPRLSHPTKQSEEKV